MDKIQGSPRLQASTTTNFFTRYSAKEIAITFLALAAITAIVLGIVWFCKPAISLLEKPALMGLVAGGGGVLFILTLALLYFRRGQEPSKSSPHGPNAPDPVVPPPILKPLVFETIKDHEGKIFQNLLAENEYFLSRTGSIGLGYSSQIVTLRKAYYVGESPNYSNHIEYEGSWITVQRALEIFNNEKHWTCISIASLRGRQAAERQEGTRTT